MADSDVVESVAEEKKSTAAAHEFNEQGHVAFNQGRFADAVDMYTEAITRARTAIHYYNRAKAYMKLGEHTFAWNDASAALKLEPNYTEARYLGALARIEFGEFKEALEDLLECSSTMPDLSELQLQRCRKLLSERERKNRKFIASRKPHGPSTEPPAERAAAEPNTSQSSCRARFAACIANIEAEPMAWALQTVSALVSYAYLVIVLWPGDNEYGGSEYTQWATRVTFTTTSIFVYVCFAVRDEYKELKTKLQKENGDRKGDQGHLAAKWNCWLFIKAFRSIFLSRTSIVVYATAVSVSGLSEGDGPALVNMKIVFASIAPLIYLLHTKVERIAQGGSDVPGESD
eukprot:scaffold1548_cov186-Pinguiococcus_pyrenoidosus.AAC.4